jgi:20S proteasome alpha/beta subunit
LLIGGVSEGKPKLYTSEITGNYYEYNAIAIGQNDDKIKEILRKEYRKDIKIDEAARLALKIFKDVLGDKFDINRFNVGVIKTEDKKLKKLSIEQIKNLE